MVRVSNVSNMNDPVVISEVADKVSKSKKANVFSERTKLKVNYTEHNYDYNSYGNNVSYTDCPKLKKE